MNEIEVSAEKFKNKINIFKHKKLLEFIDLIYNNNKKFINDKFKKTYPNLRIFIGNSIKKLIYNYSDSKILEKLKNINLKNKIIE
jgi:hypothetical protein